MICSLCFGLNTAARLTRRPTKGPCSQRVMRVDGRSFTLSHTLKHRFVPKDQCCNEPSGSDTELATEQQSCQLPDGDEEVRGEGRGLLRHRTGVKNSAIDHLDWEPLRDTMALRKIAERHSPESADGQHLSQHPQQSVCIPKLEATLTDRVDRSLLRFIRRRSRVFNSDGAKIFSWVMMSECDKNKSLMGNWKLRLWLNNICEGFVYLLLNTVCRFCLFTVFFGGHDTPSRNTHTHMHKNTHFPAGKHKLFVK